MEFPPNELDTPFPIELKTHPSVSSPPGFQYLCTSQVGTDHVAATKATRGTAEGGRICVFSLEKCGFGRFMEFKSLGDYYITN